MRAPGAITVSAPEAEKISPICCFLTKWACRFLLVVQNLASPGCDLPPTCPRHAWVCWLMTRISKATSDPCGHVALRPCSARKIRCPAWLRFFWFLISRSSGVSEQPTNATRNEIGDSVSTFYCSVRDVRCGIVPAFGGDVLAGVRQRRIHPLFFDFSNQRGFDHLGLGGVDIEAVAESASWRNLNRGRRRDRAGCEKRVDCSCR